MTDKPDKPDKPLPLEDEVLRRMLNTPPKPKKKPASAKSPKKKP